MAITERYVTTTGSGGDGSSGNPWSITEAMTNAVAGDRVNVKTGTYTLAANLAPGASGTGASPIIWRGYNTSIGDLSSQGRLSSNGNLDTTNFPVIDGGSSYYWSVNSKVGHIIESLKVTGSRNGRVMDASTNWMFRNVYIVNTGTSASCSGLYASAGPIIVLNSDLELSGASGGLYCGYAANTSSFWVGCRVRDSQAVGLTLGVSGVVAFCVIDADTVGVDVTSATANVAFLFNTIYGGTDPIRTPNATSTANLLMLGNHLTDGSGYAVNSQYSSGNPALIASNRFRDNTSGNTVGFGDWAAATDWWNVTTDTGSIETDFVNAPSDFNLIAAAPALAAGFLPFLDIGALQRQCSSSGGGGPLVGGRLVR